MPIGFIGLGRMGNPMARSLLKAGQELVVYDTRPEAVRDLVTAGAEEAPNPKDLSSRCEVILTSLPTPEVLEEVITGPEGVLEGAEPGSTLILLDTISPETARKIGKITSSKKMSVLDSPVSGGPDLAKEGAIAVMVGGDRETFERNRSLLEGIGKSVFYVGKLGSGCVVKLTNNLLSLGNVAVLCEGLVLGTKAGVDPKTMWEIISKSTGRSFASDFKVPRRIAKGNFQGGFSVALSCKDLGLITSMAKQVSFQTPFADLVRHIYEKARDLGLGELDHTALIKMLEEAEGVSVRFDSE